MPSLKTTVTQAEIRRCLKAARDAGYSEARVEIAKPDGTKVTVVALKASEAADPSDDIDRLIAKLP